MPTTHEVIEHHLERFAAGDLDGLMADYTDESVLLTPNGALVGPGPIRGMFSALMAEFAKPGASFHLQTRFSSGDVAFIVWSAQTADNRYEFATDTFVVEAGRIRRQTYAGKVVPRG